MSTHQIVMDEDAYNLVTVDLQTSLAILRICTERLSNNLDEGAALHGALGIATKARELLVDSAKLEPKNGKGGAK